MRGCVLVHYAEHQGILYEVYEAAYKHDVAGVACMLSIWELYASFTFSARLIPSYDYIAMKLILRPIIPK